MGFFKRPARFLPLVFSRCLTRSILVVSSEILARFAAMVFFTRVARFSPLVF